MKILFYFFYLYLFPCPTSNCRPVKAVDHKICQENHLDLRFQLLGRKISSKKREGRENMYTWVYPRAPAPNVSLCQCDVLWVVSCCFH